MRYIRPEDADIPWTAEDTAELLATADESLDRLPHLVENLLDMSRLQAGALSLFPRPAGLDEVVARALDAVSADPAILERMFVPFQRLGGDDYVTKPFGVDELLARMRAADVRLTPTEWHLLEVLLRNPGKLLSQKQLLNDVWGPGYGNAAGNLRLYMAQLRRKIEPDPARPRWLITEPGMGYRFQPPADSTLLFPPGRASRNCAHN